MKILHCADFHITCLKKLLGEENAFDRAQKALYSLSRIIWSENPDVITIVGDIFNSDDPDSDELFLFNQWLFPILEEGITVLIVPGNHDSWAKGGKTAIDFTLPMDESLDNLYIALREPKLAIIKDVAFIMWPWGINPSKEDKALLNRSKIPKLKIGLMHTALKNSVISKDGRVLKKGFNPNNAKITLEMFKLSYLLLGDIHEYQTFFNDRVIYSGSLYQTKFSESINKGVVIIDTDTLTHKFVRVLDVPKLFEIEDLSKVTKNDFFKLRAPSKEDTVRMLNSKLPENVVRIEHAIKRQSIERLDESSTKLNFEISLIPIFVKILHKQGVKDIKGAMKYLISLAETKADFTLP